MSLGALKPFLGSKKPLNNDVLAVDLPLMARIELVDSCGNQGKQKQTKKTMTTSAGRWTAQAL